MWSSGFRSMVPLLVGAGLTCGLESEEVEGLEMNFSEWEKKCVWG